MEAQVAKALNKLKKQCTRSHKEVRDSIDATTNALNQNQPGGDKKKPTATSAASKLMSTGLSLMGGLGGGSGSSSSSAAGIGGIAGGTLTEVPFEPFLLACMTRHSKLVAVALDSIEKFLAFGFLRGNGSIPDSIRKRLIQKSGASARKNNSLANLVGYAGSGATPREAGGGASGGGNDPTGLSNSAGASATADALEGGAGSGSSLNENNWKLIDCIIEVVCDCNEHPDETVQIQVLRVLLTAVTTPTCEVHEHSLLKAVRACYHIHLVSKNSTNQTVAKATLQQIIAIVFQRMETFDQRVLEETEAKLKEAMENQNPNGNHNLPPAPVADYATTATTSTDGAMPPEAPDQSSSTTTAKEEEHLTRSASMDDVTRDASEHEHEPVEPSDRILEDGQRLVSPQDTTTEEVKEDTKRTATTTTPATTKSALAILAPPTACWYPDVVRKLKIHEFERLERDLHSELAAQQSAEFATNAHEVIDDVSTPTLDTAQPTSVVEESAHSSHENSTADSNSRHASSSQLTNADADGLPEARADDTQAQEVPQEVNPTSLSSSSASRRPMGIKSTSAPLSAGGGSGLSSSSFPSVLHKDAFLLFRSLCRISMRSVAEDAVLSSGVSSSSTSGSGSNPADDPFAFQSKILSLELVLSIINNAGPSFRKGERFIHAIRQYLCQSLLQNCTSNYTQIVGLSLQVFLVLINNFKFYLKAEIEIFVTSIFLRILQSDNSSFEHKMLVLEVLNNLCEDAAILGEIFLNYDCDWVSNDLFKQIVDALAKIAKGKKDAALQNANLSSSMRQKLQQNESALVLKGLECLTATVASLKKAANFVETEKKTMTTTNAVKEPTSAEDENEPTTTAPLMSPPSSSSGGGIAGNSTMSAVEAFDRKKRRQEELATGILKFNVKPSAGIQYLVQRGHLGKGTPRDVAQFIMEHSDKLDKTMVGDYLGKEQAYQNGFCIKVLHEYVDMMDFSGLDIDVAIRQFLAGFRLPGESQKIDRMMEKFAERFYSTCAQPTGLFPSADTAFILSFSIIMLQTDLHNPSVPEEKKMDKGSFLRNNRGINNGEDLPDDYLGGIYDRIKANPISLKEDEEQRRKVISGRGGPIARDGRGFPLTDRQRRENYIKERETIMRQSEALFRRRTPGMSKRALAMAVSPINADAAASVNANGGSGSGSTSLFSPSSGQFHLVTDFTEVGHVRPMFETVWAPLLAVCSVIFESWDSPVAIQLCLNSFKHAIHLAGRLKMPSERDAFVTVLAKFTGLHMTGSKVLKPKNIESIKALISIAVKEGNYMEDAWRDILQCISQLARVQMLAQGLQSDTQFFTQPPSSAGTSPNNSSSPYASTPSNARRTRDSSGSTSTPTSARGSSASDYSGGGGSSGLAAGEDTRNSAIEEENAARIMAEIDVLASDRVFSSSMSLSDQAVQDFILQLCVVSLTECSGVSARVLRDHPIFGPPRVFSLQKLVEVADMNMHTRSRVVWASMWKNLSRHFTTIGCHDNLSIAMYAIDSLRQLSMKFLEKAELKDFNFQRLFLTPFEVIMSNAISMEIRELVLRCVENMILARVANIKSGWKTIWGVLRVAAETYEIGDKDERIVSLGFSIAKRVFENHFDRIVEVFVDAVECLLAFAVCGSEEVEKQMDEHLGLTKIGMDAIELLENVCFAKLATGQVIEVLLEMSSNATSGNASKRVGFKKKSVYGPDDVMRYEKQESTKSLEEDIEAATSNPSSPRRRSSSLASNRKKSRTASVTTSSAEISEEQPASPPSTTIYTDSASHTRMWWPVLTALSTLASDRRIDIRLCALKALFDSLHKYGDKFSSGFWSLIFKGVLIPVLDEIRHLEVYIEKGVRQAPKLLNAENVSSRGYRSPTAAASASRSSSPRGFNAPSPVQSTSSGVSSPRDGDWSPEAQVQSPRPLRESTSTLCLERILELFGEFYDTVGFLPEVVFLLGKCMESEKEQELAVASAGALEQLLVVHGHKFAEDVWGLIADELRSVMTRAEPTWIFFDSEASSAGGTSGGKTPRTPAIISMYPSVVSVLRFVFLPMPKMIFEDEIRSQPSQTHLIVILEVQRVLSTVLASKIPRNLHLSNGHFHCLMVCLKESFLFARKLNDNVEIRKKLKDQGWSYGCGDHDHEHGEHGSELPSLLPQEVQGKHEYLKLLFHLIQFAPSESRREDARRQMTSLVRQTFGEYLAWTDSEVDNFDGNPITWDHRQRTRTYVTLMVGTLELFAALSATELRLHIKWLYPLLTALIRTKNEDVRCALALVFSQSIQQLLPL